MHITITKTYKNELIVKRYNETFGCSSSSTSQSSSTSYNWQCTTKGDKGRTVQNATSDRGRGIRAQRSTAERGGDRRGTQNITEWAQVLYWKKVEETKESVDL